jgi:hypothetical protein
MLRELLLEILNGWVSATREPYTNHRIAKKLRTDLALIFENYLKDRTGEKYQIKASAGAGNWANVPWLSILDTGHTNSTQEGIYPVYLFRADGSGCYLSLGFGTTKLTTLHGAVGAKNTAKKIASKIHETTPEILKWGQDKIDLHATTNLGKSYEWASAGSKFYPIDAIPSDDEILHDLHLLLDIYKKIPSNFMENSVSLEKETNKQIDTILIPKPFILLAGISGTGKTRFVREQALRHKVGDINFCQIPVRPDWHEPSDLLGYISRISGTKYIATKALKFIIDAWRLAAPNADESGLGELDLSVAPYWLCLDEMNLAPVEQYFADYLSVLESRKFKDGEYSCEPLLTKDVFELGCEDIRLDLGINADEDGLWDYFCKHGIALPPNLIVAGTVNMDETTHGFSRKVIDRAFTLDFGEFFPNDYQTFFTGQALPKVLTYSQLTHATQNELSSSIDVDGKMTVEFLESINTVLKRTPFELAYRALNELLLHVACFNPQDNKALQAVWDDFMMTKILPRIDGDDDKLRLVRGTETVNLLDAMVEVLKEKLNEIWAEGETRVDFFRSTHELNEINNIPCRSRLKIKWMKNRLDTNTFTSFWP